MVKIEILKKCINQDNKKRLKPGDILKVSEMEAGRHLAEENARLYPVETAVKKPPCTMVTRKGATRKKRPKGEARTM